MKIKLLLPLFGLLLLGSCAEEETPAPVPEPEPTDFCYLQEQSTISKTDTSTVTYRYDAQNRVIGTTHLENNTMVASRTYEYDSNGRLIRETLFGPEAEEINYILFSYSADGRLSKYEVLQPLSIGTIHKVGAFKATYNPNGSLASTTSYYYQDNQLKQEQSARFSYPRDSTLSVTVTFRDSERNYTGSYVMDKSRAPLSAVPAFHIRQPQLGYPGRNNLLSLAAKRGEEDAKAVSFKTEYTYNGRGYPTKAVKTFGDGTVATTTYSYDCL
ncbi:hypothetical protein [Pontibacter akesuensis]|uniref:YD repeat-containing protein n=1 Tax=Pontibacter akesuensis TaxID=388950 RepID=A0A1I7GCZ2_9BACT|nr:hypothetical protein [Pontibacter akesuensis]GHA57509.1 hypothetical protein GCM10007389_06510 [Pontibacter akesuensis]SFU46300.1 YD repeat-containing protein [Pontibacter akesuensis]